MNDDDRRPDDGLQVDPVRIDRARSLVPAVLVVVLSVAFVGLAVAKPWEAGDATTAVAASASPKPEQTRPSATASPASGPTATPFPIRPTPADLVAVVSDRHEWGVRAVVVPVNGRPAGDGTGSGLAQRWLAVDVASGAAWDAGVTGTAVAPGEAVLALGVTTPDDSMSLDIRFWRLDPYDGALRVMPRPVPGPEAGSWLYLPDRSEATILDGWPAGTYQIDVLLGSRIVRLITVVPSGTRAAEVVAPEVGEPADLVDQLTPFGAGPFAVTPRSAIAIDDKPYDLLPEREAWLGPATGQLEVGAVGRVTADPVMALGLLLKPGERFVSADLERVVPVAATAGIQTIPLPPVPRSDSERAAAVVFEYGDLRPLGSGFFHLTADTIPASGVARTQTWNIEIVPSADSPPTVMPWTEWRAGSR